MSETDINPNADGSQIRVPVRVRYAECDPQGVAHHSAYPVWLELARTELLRANGMVYREQEEQGIYFVVARLNIRYRRPARYDDLLTIHVELLRCGASIVEHRYQIRREGELIAEAQTTLACTGADGRPRRVPEAMERCPQRAAT